MCKSSTFFFFAFTGERGAHQLMRSVPFMLNVINVLKQPVMHQNQHFGAFLIGSETFVNLGCCAVCGNSLTLTDLLKHCRLTEIL